MPELRRSVGPDVERSWQEGATGAPVRKGLLVLVLTLAVVLPGALAGCAATAQNNPFTSGRAANEIQVTIQNQNFNDATIWALWQGGIRIRLGRLSGNATRTFTTEWRSDVVRFQVDFLAGREYTTGQVYVSPGDHLDLTLRP